jgi:hypothetical protein
MGKRIKKREQFEVIIDSCCAGDRVLNGANKLIDFAIDGNKTYHPIFEDYKVTIPIQIGTELKRRVFPEFLESEIRTKTEEMKQKGKKPSAFEVFFMDHLEGVKKSKRQNKHVLVEENEISRAYKLIYAAKAEPILRNDREMIGQVAQNASYFLRRYYYNNENVVHSVSPDEVIDFCDKIRAAYQEHEEAFALTEKKMREHNASLTKNVDGLIEEEDVAAFMKLKTLAIDLAVSGAQRENLARSAKRLFKDASPIERCIMQAIYSHSPLHQQVSEDDKLDNGFKNFRKDQGERSIERYLVKKRSKPDPERVTVVITKDRGALNGIEYVRTQGAGHTIIGLSPYGLALTLKELGAINKLEEVLDADTLDVTAQRRSKIETKRTQRPLDTPPVDASAPEHEEKWAHRLAEVMRWGDYEDRLKKIDKRKNGKSGQENGGRQ